MKRETTDWDKIFPIHIPDKGFISEMYKELTQLKSKKRKTQLKKMKRDFRWIYK